MPKIQRVIPAFLILIAVIGPVQGQDLRMPIGAISAGASESGTSEVRMQSTVGQPAVGRSDAAANVLSAGFWYQVRAELGVVHTNAPPSPAHITEPADGIEIVIGSIHTDSPLTPETPFTVRWTGGLDPDDDTVSFTWQLATTADFSEPLLEENAGSEPLVRTSLGTLAEVLADAGVDLGESLTLMHRVITSDGQFSTAGPASKITFVRGRLVNVEEDQQDLPTSFTLAQNYPNPFNPTTTIGYDLPSERHVRLAVYDVFGREVATLVDEFQRPGRHEVRFMAGGLASGLYLYRLDAGDYREARSMLLAK